MDSHYQLSSASSASSHCCFDLLSDDALVAIGGWVAATGAENYAKCLKVCRRFRTVLGEPALIKECIRERIAGVARTGTRTAVVTAIDNATDDDCAPENTDNDATATPAATTATGAMTTLEHLALWEATREIGLWEENRIGFDYGSVSIARDNDSNRQMMFRRLRAFGAQDDDIEDILGSRDRVAKISSRILRRFPDSFLRIEAHTGTAAPARIADRFSVARGLAVVRAFLDRLQQPDGRDNFENEDEEEQYMDDHDLAIAEQRLILTPWGMRISEAAAQSDHRYGRVARQGKGWVEIYICHHGDDDEIEMPTRPAFYNGQTQDMDDTESGDEAGHVIEIFLGGHGHASDRSDEGSVASQVQMGVVDNMGDIEEYEDSDEE